MARPRIAPSILSADFTRLGEEIATIEPYVEMLHLDVMDGHFVPNLSFGMPLIAGLRRISNLFFDVHLMTTNPDSYFPELRAAGADLVTVHIEVYPDPTRIAEKAREQGLAFGLAVNPPTPFEAVEPFVELADMILIMSVNPGFGGQTFIPEVLSKVRAARRMIDDQGLATDIEIDGGITADTAIPAREAGADVFVAGSSIFASPDRVQAVKQLRRAVDREGDE